MAAFWGFVSGAAYFAIVYEIWLGSASKLAAAAGGVLKAHKILCWFVLVGWAIYPLGYMMGTTGWYNGIVPAGNSDVAYNVQMQSTKLVSDW
jgi:bacteriorhodopsin